MNQGKKTPSFGAMLARYMVLGVGTIYVLRALDKYLYSPKGGADETIHKNGENSSKSSEDQLNSEFNLEKAIASLEKPKAPPARPK
jgi:hypothetical protein